jgi:hypothetical protein
MTADNVSFDFWNARVSKLRQFATALIERRYRNAPPIRDP